MVPSTTPEAPGQEVITRTGRPESRRAGTRTTATAKKRVLTGTEKPITKMTTGGGMSAKIN